MSAPTFTLPGGKQVTDAKAEIDSVPDTGPAGERRSRGGPVIDKRGFSVALNDEVTVTLNGSAKVIGHGRGVGNVLVAQVVDGRLEVMTLPVSILNKV